LYRGRFLGAFLDEDVVYATKHWAAEVEAELHIRLDGFHSFIMFGPETEITRGAITQEPPG